MKIQYSIIRLPKMLSVFALAITSLIAVMPDGNAEVIYSQNFGHTGAATNNFSIVGWTTRWQSTGTAGSQTITETPGHVYYMGLYNYQGKPIDQANVNAPVSASDEYGVVRFYSADNLFPNSLIYTTQYTVDRSQFQLDSISWYAGATVLATYARAALMIDNVWYVSDQVNSTILSGNNPANFNTSAALKTIDVATTGWFVLNATLGETFSIGETPVSLPTGDVSAFGIYSIARQVSGSYSMFDTFTLNATVIPEPNSLVLIMMAGAYFLTTKRRRKSA